MHKLILLGSILAAGLTLQTANAAELMTYRVCEDQHVLRTSDGAEAGHVEYIVVDPGEHRVVSAVVTGGVVADRHVAIPIDAMRFGGQREVTLTKITREQIISAPVVETSRFTATAVIEPSVFEKTYTHFGYDPATITRTTTRTSVSTTDPRDSGFAAPDRALVRERENTNVDVRASVGTNERMNGERREGFAGREGDPAAVRGDTRTGARAEIGGRESTERAARDGEAAVRGSRAGDPAANTTRSNMREGGDRSASREGADRATSREGASKESAESARGSTRESARTPSGEDRSSAGSERTRTRGESGSGDTTRTKASPGATGERKAASSEESAPAGSTKGRAEGAGSSEAKHTTPGASANKGHSETRTGGASSSGSESRSSRPDAQ